LVCGGCCCCLSPPLLAAAAAALLLNDAFPAPGFDDWRLFAETGDEVPLLRVDDADACVRVLLSVSSLDQTMARLHTMHTSSMAAGCRTSKVEAARRSWCGLTQQADPARPNDAGVPIGRAPRLLLLCFALLLGRVEAELRSVWTRDARRKRAVR
jgi:hypothetical protein